MFRLLRERMRKHTPEPLASLPLPPESGLNTFEERLEWFHSHLTHCSDIVIREFVSDSGVKGAILYIQEMIDMQLFEAMVENGLLQSGELTREAVNALPQPAMINVSRTDSIQEALQQLLEGQLLFFTDSTASFQILPLAKTEKRAVTESSNENVIRGPKEAFIEDIKTNITMIRRRIKHPALKTELIKFGTFTQTSVMLVYLEGLCKQELIDEIKQRLGRIQIDGVLGTGQLEEFINDNPYSPFPLLQYTERPDTVTAALLEGRAAIFCDGTPMPILAPVTLYMLLQSAEDYYQNYIAATWIRWIRFLFLLISLLLPSIYIAVITFHPEMMPPNLLITVAASREPTPFPALVEAIIMELAFEALREGGLRIPKPLGQTISIIGALIIGQSAVEAGIVSAPMVIIVSMTGIASFVIPHYNLGLSMRLIRFPIMIMAGSFGLFGIIVSIFLIYLHLVSLRSFGTPYLAPLAPMRLQDWKDAVVRAPWWSMHTRPELYGTAGGTRESKVKRPQIPADQEGD
jgi:spore germination protein